MSRPHDVWNLPPRGSKAVRLRPMRSDRSLQTTRNAAEAHVPLLGEDSQRCRIGRPASQQMRTLCLGKYDLFTRYAGRISSLCRPSAWWAEKVSSTTGLGLQTRDFISLRDASCVMKDDLGVPLAYFVQAPCSSPLLASIANMSTSPSVVPRSKPTADHCRNPSQVAIADDLPAPGSPTKTEKRLRDPFPNRRREENVWRDLRACARQECAKQSQGETIEGACLSADVLERGRSQKPSSSSSSHARSLLRHYAHDHPVRAPHSESVIDSTWITAHCQAPSTSRFAYAKRRRSPSGGLTPRSGGATQPAFPVRPQP